jgi:alkanesulfonate monooxygenase SsuD/methylene tetrahydromethanopterin reductase-like flavin-dependent oxidoreductase (luciferase family)
MFALRFDMRAPDFGAPTAELYETALEIAAWAETRGAVACQICEHHMSPDGYLPSPLILTSAMAARTTKLPIMIGIVQLPLYNPVRLAEEMVVLDIISKGRVSDVGGLGYLPYEYEMLGGDFKARGKTADDYLALLLQAVKGEPFAYQGRKIHVTPAPFTPGGPKIAWGGGSLPAARRADASASTSSPNAKTPFSATPIAPPAANMATSRKPACCRRRTIRPPCSSPTISTRRGPTLGRISCRTC